MWCFSVLGHIIVHWFQYIIRCLYCHWTILGNYKKYCTKSICRHMTCVTVYSCFPLLSSRNSLIKIYHNLLYHGCPTSSPPGHITQPAATFKMMYIQYYNNSKKIREFGYIPHCDFYTNGPQTSLQKPVVALCAHTHTYTHTHTHTKQKVRHHVLASALCKFIITF